MADIVRVGGKSREEVALELLHFMRGVDDNEGRKRTKVEILKQYAECLSVAAGLAPPER